MRPAIAPLHALTLWTALACAACGDDSTPTGPRAIDPAAERGGSTESRRGAWFTDVSRQAGLDFTHDAGMTDERHLPETMGAGAVLADLDADGDLDLYLVQSGPVPVQGTRTAPATNRLYLNDGSGRFEEATARSGAAAHDGYGMGVVAGDVDADGDLDLFVTNWGPDVLLLNDGRAAFEAADAPNLADPRWTTGATFFDADGDDDLDLFVTGYVHFDPHDPIWCGEREPGYRSYCHPDTYDGIPDRFYRNDGRGVFSEATAAAGLATPPDAPGKGLGVIAGDFDGDGSLDLYVANDSVANRLWINRGDGTFEDGTLLSGTGVNGRGMTEAGMGLATGDVDGDGDIDLFVTNFDDESNTLYRNEGGGLFSDGTVAAGLEAPSRRPVGFGTVLFDADADGDLDLAVANGHIIHNVELYDDGKTHAQVAQFFVNDGGGVFAEATAAAGDLSARPVVGRGLYAGDLDGDGDPDLLLTECNGPARLLRNDGPPGGRAGESLHLDGLPAGTRVVATTTGGRRLVREAGTQVSYLGGSSSGVILGLGTSGDAVRRLELLVPGREGRDLELSPARARGRLRFLDGPDGLRLP